MFQIWVLGINKRNIDYIKKFNPKKSIRLVDNKYKTKEFLRVRWIPTPETYAIISDRKQLFNFDFGSIPSAHFVVKPNHGSKGKWIYITRRIDTYNAPRKRNFFQKYLDKLDEFLYGQFPEFPYGYQIGEKTLDDLEFKNKLVSILEGNYTLWNKPDSILIEEKLLPGEGFEDFCDYWLADMRIIVCNLVPVIAMVRMPTKDSDGKANLAQWWIGLGVDIVSGKIKTFYYNKQIYKSQFPSPYQDLYNALIPFWDDLLIYSANIQYFLNMGYVGLDWVITTQGPKLLEVNGKAWLEIQNVSLLPLEKILAKIDDIQVSSPQKGVEITKSLLWSEKWLVTESIKAVYLSQKGVLVASKKGLKKQFDLVVTTNTEKKRNYIHPKFIQKLQIKNSDIQLKLPDSEIIIKNILLHKSANIKTGTIQLWSNVLQDYYLKPVHKLYVASSMVNPQKVYDEELTALQIFDQKLYDIYKRRNISYILKPVNYVEQFDKFISKRGKYNPVFSYNFPKNKDILNTISHLQELKDRYKWKNAFRSPFADLLFEKLDETYDKVMLTQSYKEQNFEKIRYYNEKLFGSIDNNVFSDAQDIIKNFEPYKASKFGRILRAEKIDNYIKEYTKQYIPESIQIERSTATMSRISVVFGRRIKFRILNNAVFRELELEGQLKHEFNTHYYRYWKGLKTWWKILMYGTWYYVVDEEGLAIYQSQDFLKKYMPEYENIGVYNKYVLAAYAQKYNFIGLNEMFHDMIRKKWNKMTMRWLFNALVKVKKWIIDTSIQDSWAAFLRNIAYLRWYNKVSQWVDQWNDISRLLIGKIKIDDLDKIE